jgi:hypothetical protein
MLLGLVTSSTVGEVARCIQSYVYACSAHAPGSLHLVCSLVCPYLDMPLWESVARTPLYDMSAAAW